MMYEIFLIAWNFCCLRSRRMASMGRWGRWGRFSAGETSGWQWCVIHPWCILYRLLLYYNIYVSCSLPSLNQSCLVVFIVYKVRQSNHPTPAMNGLIPGMAGGRGSHQCRCRMAG